MQKKVLITGASGFLGSHLAEICHMEGMLLFGIDKKQPLNKNIWSGFITEGLASINVQYLFEKTAFDIIFHLAGSASVMDSVKNPEKDWNSLLPPTLTLLNLIKTNCISTHLILFSSAAVYGNPSIFPVSETAALNPLSPYGIHKALAEDMIKYYSKYFGFRSTILRIFSAFGEGLRKQLFWDVMTRYEKKRAENEDKKPALDLFGSGQESRDFIHAKDVAKASLLIARSNHKYPNNFNVFNVASGKEINIRKAIEYLFSKSDRKPIVTFNGTARAGDPERWQADISKIKEIGFITDIKLKDSLTGYYEWFMHTNKQ